jgi:hypothetical protein
MASAKTIPNKPKVRQSRGIRRIIAETLEGATTTENRLLVALADPANWKVTKIELCRRAGVSYERFRQLCLDPAFQTKMRWALQVVVGDITEALKALKASAESPDPRSSTDRRILFEMAGLIGGRYERNVEVKIQYNTQLNIEQRLGLIPHSQILWLYLRLNFPQGRWLPGIRDAYLHGNLKPEQPPLPRIGAPDEGAIDVDAVQIAEPPLASERPIPALNKEDAAELAAFAADMLKIKADFPAKYHRAIDVLQRVAE